MKIAVLMGGTSAEREVSLRSGNAIYNACKKLGFEVVKIDPINNIETYKPELLGNDLVFIGLHGGDGENGVIQRYLEKIDVDFTGSKSDSSALCMDKNLSKIQAKKIGVLTPDWFVIESLSDYNRNIMHPPFVAKPIDQGSTLGLFIVNENSEIKKSITSSLKFSNKVLIESFINGKEMTVPIIGNKALPVVEITPKSGFYDYDSKYTKGMTNYFSPANITTDLANKLKEQALMIHDTLGCRHYSRVDFRVDSNDNPWFLEINTLPGMTETSLMPISANSDNINFDDLINEIIMQAISSNNKRN